MMATNHISLVHVSFASGQILAMFRNKDEYKSTVLIGTVYNRNEGIETPSSHGRDQTSALAGVF